MTATSPPANRVVGKVSRSAKADRFRKALELLAYDTYAVFHGLSENAKRRTSSENVADTLDALVRLARAQK